jgi:hypothetical protein
MNASRFVAVGALVLAVASTIPGEGWAQTPEPTTANVEQAAQLFDQGVAAIEQNDFATALRSFEESYRLNPVPDVLYNVAMCHKALGNLPAAANAFRDYVEARGGNLAPEEQAEFDALLVELAPQIGRVMIEVTEAGASIAVDGVAVGTSPLSGWYAVIPGRHRIDVAKPGFEPFSSEVDVAAGETPAVSVPLVALAVTPPVGPGPTIRIEPEQPEEAEELSPWFWTCVGIAGASALTMAITGGLTLKYNGDFDDGGRTDASLRDTTLALRTTTDVFLGIGIAAVIAGTVLFFVSPDEDSSGGPSTGDVALATSGLLVWW